MYSWGNFSREAKQRKQPQNPTFSSSLLDGILHKEGYKLQKEKSRRNHYSNYGGAREKSITIEDEDMESLKRAYLISKLMENKLHQRDSSIRMAPSSSLPKMGGRSLHDNISPISSNSRNHCFAKPQKANVKRKPSPLYYEPGEYCMFENYLRSQEQNTISQGNSIKSKSMASKIYSNLKPLSPSFRITSFINSIFSNGSGKKAKNVTRNEGLRFTKAPASSSASSFSRSCLSKSGTNKSREKFNNGIKRTVRFDPVSIIIGEDCNRCGYKSIYREELHTFRWPHYSSERLLSPGAKSSLVEKYRGIESGTRDVYKGFQSKRKDNILMERIIHKNFGNYEDNEDAGSDSSSDLFEIDHLAFMRNNGYSDELPVYETTYLDEKWV